jgi:hypothetical protein
MPERSLPEMAEDRSTWRLMTTRAKLETVVICAAFALYAVFALKLLLFSRPPGSGRVGHAARYPPVGRPFSA